MNADRRSWLKRGGFALLGSGWMSRVDKVAAMQAGAAPVRAATGGGSWTAALKREATGRSESLLLGPKPGEEGPPAPARHDRLPLEWNRATVKRLKDTLAERDVQAFLVR